MTDDTTGEMPEDIPDDALGPEEPAATDTASNGAVKAKRVDLPKSTRTIDRWGMNPEDRARVLEQCLLLQRSGWKANFALMMTAAVVVAIMGLSANSAAVVIGAMLIAPLMTPVLGIAASITMALGPALVRSLTTVTVASVGAIAMGFIAGRLLPDAPLSDQILARTQPDIKDLFVALAAGIAGSYATARPDTSSSLPGVAIAVALVPPLAVVGLAAEATEYQLALGALLLYITNLAAIVFMSSLVFIATGFVPGRRLMKTAPRVVLGAVAALAVLVFVGWFLARATIDASEIAGQQREIRAVIDEWLAGSGNELEDLDYNEVSSKVSIEVSGVSAPPPSAALQAQLQPVAGDDVSVAVDWIPVQQGARFDAAEVDTLIDDWITDRGGVEAFELSSREISNEQIAVNLTVPPGVEPDGSLQNELQNRFAVPAIVEFTERQTVAERTVTELTTDRVNSEVAEWAGERELEAEVTTSYEGDELTLVEVTTRGVTRPTLESLEMLLAEREGYSGDVDLFFVEQVKVELIPTPTPVPTATPVPTPEPTPEGPAPIELVFSTPTPIATPAADG